jgi:lipoyl(octanoyl) transferase
VHRYVRDIEEVMIRVCADYGVTARRIEGLTGAWVGPAKIGAIGVRISRWITSHGFAFNVDPNLDHFNLIVPCGISDKSVTSLRQQVGRELRLEDVEGRLIPHFAAVFNHTVTHAMATPA